MPQFLDCGGQALTKNSNRGTEMRIADMRPPNLSSRSHRHETARQPATLVRVRNVAAMALAASSGATDAIGYLVLGHVFTSAMTGNLALLGIALAHHDGERIGRVLVSLVCYMGGAALGARIARTPQPGDPLWPPAITRALALEAVFFVMYAVYWWAVGARLDVEAKAVLLGLGAIALGIQSSAMQRFGDGLGLNTTFVSGALVKLVGRLATGHRYRDLHHHLLVLVGLVCGGSLGALLVLHAPAFAPLVQLGPFALALGAAGWQARAGRRVAKGTRAQAVSTA
jgi:uncharacterized membrane protein YoaK (UPF0700 family)